MKNILNKNIVGLLIGCFVLFSASTNFAPSTQVSKVIMDSSVSGTYTIECDQMPQVDVHLTLVGDATIKVNGCDNQSIINLMIHQDAIGGHTITLDLDQFATEGGIQPAFSEVALECNSLILMGSSGNNEVHLMAKPALGVKHQ